MDQEREPRLRRLEDAIEAYLAKDDTVPVETVLAQNEPVADLLGPMLQSPSDFGDDPPARQRIGDLDLVREIGRGGMGVVYEAEDALLKRRVAVKVMARSAETTPSSIVRFRREAELAASLKHPAVVPVHSLGETDEAFYLVMELERAASLAEVLAEMRGLDVANARPGMLREAIACAVASRFPDAPTTPATSTDGHARTAAAIVLQVAEALGQAHAKGVIHRDVKPGNILVEASGRAYLTDFGLACVQSDPAVTQAGSAPGTPQYMAPEQVRGDRDAVGPATDVFALGATLYEALTLRRAFPGDSVTAVLFAVTHRDPIDPSKLVPTLPRDLVAIVQRALEKNPTARYPTAAEFAADLAAFLRGDPVSARPVNYLGRLRRQTAREPWRALVALLVAIGVPTLVVLAIAANRRDSQTQLGQQMQQAAWLDTQLAHGFREAGEGDLVAAQECFTDILTKAPGHEEGIAGLSVVARSRGDSAALAILQQHPIALQNSAALRRRQAALLRRQGKVAAADAVARDLVTEPIGFDAFLHGYADLELGHAGDEQAFARAKRLLHRAIVSSDHPRPLFYYEWLHAAAHAGDADDVDAAIAAIEKLWPDAASSWFWISFARDRLGDTAKAIAALEHAQQLEPDFLSAALNHARLVRRSGQPHAAIAQLRQLLDKAPRPALVHRELAIALCQIEDYQTALQSYRAALPVFGNDAVVLREYAGTLVATGAGAQAVLVLDDLVRRHPADVDARLALAMTLQRLNRHGEAREQLQRCVEQRTSAPACYALGISESALGNPTAAQQAYEKALAIDGAHAGAAVNLAILRLRAGDPATAERLLRQALTVDPTLLQARRALLRLLETRPAEAVQMCRDWVTLAPTLGEAKRHLAWALLQTGDAAVSAEALGFARTAAAAPGGDDAATQQVLGAALLANGEAQAARDTVQKALAGLDPADRFTPYYEQQLQATLQQCEAALGKR